MLGAVRPTAGGGGGGAVSSVYGRTGAVAAASGDYAASQIVGLGGGAGAVVLTPGSTQMLTAASTITPSAAIIPITAASPITLTSNPQIGAGSNGQRLTLANIGGQSITLAAGNGLLLPQNYVLYGGRTVGFTYFTAFSSWIVDGIIPESAVLTGAPTTPNPTWNTNSTQIAPTAFVYRHLYDHDLPGWRSLTLTANWVNFGAPFPSPACRRIGRDLIFVQGVATCSGSFAGVVTTLPVDCRPPSTINLASYSSGGPAQLSIGSNGQITASTVTPGQFHLLTSTFSL